MKLDLDDLERKARAATPRTWRWGREDGTLQRGLFATGPNAQALPILALDAESQYLTLATNTEHIAAASPPVVLALIAYTRELEAAVRACAFGGVIPSPHSVEGERRLIELLERGAVLS